MRDKKTKFLRRQRRVRSKILSTHKKPRLTIYRSLEHIYAQIIDDEKGRTLVAASDLELKSAVLEKQSKLDRAQRVGELLAKKAHKKKIKRVVFDRSGYKYHGRIKVLADAARKGGLEF